MDEKLKKKNIERIDTHRAKISAVTVVLDKRFTYGWVHYGMRVDYLSTVDGELLEKLFKIGKTLRSVEQEQEQEQ